MKTNSKIDESFGRDEYGDLRIYMDWMSREEHGISGIDKIWVSSPRGLVEKELPKFKIQFANNSARYVYDNSEIAFLEGTKPSSEINKEVIKWAEVNRKVIMDYYHGKIYTSTFCDNVVSI